MILVAVDPGLTGALAAHDTVTGALRVFDMPTFEKTVGKAKARKVIDEEGVVQLLSVLFMVDGATHLVIEQVQGLPRQSAPAAFNFGFGYGVVLTAARCLGYRIERVKPEIWKAKMRVPSDKKAARQRACEMMPEHKHLWPLAKHDGRAEAALLAQWAKGVLS